jgi:hypothetical protein
MRIYNYLIGDNQCCEPKYIHVKDAVDFLANYEDFAEMVFYRVVGNKVHIRIIAPIYVKEVKYLLEKIKE